MSASTIIRKFSLLPDTSDRALKIKSYKDTTDLLVKVRALKNKYVSLMVADFTRLKGRILSSSYIPLTDSPIFSKMILELEDLFNRHQRNGIIRIEYDTEIYYGHLT